MGKVVKTKAAATAATSKKGLSVKIETSDETVNTAPVIPPAPPAPPVMPPPPPIQETANVESAATRKDVIGFFHQISSLSPEGTKYIEDIVNTIDSIKMHPRKVDVMPGTDSIAGEYRVLIDKSTGNAILLLFTESYNPCLVPLIDRVPAIQTSNKLNLVQSIVVDKEAGDYTRADRMGAHIYNTFVAYDPSIKINASVYRDMKISANTNVNAVKAYIDRKSPHVIQDRVDWGVLLEFDDTSRNFQGYQYTQDYLRTPMLAVGGYTRFIKTNIDNVAKFYPVLVITNITAEVPVLAALNIALPIVANHIASMNLWKKPYSTFAKDQPNLGYLFQDVQNKTLKFFSSPEEMNIEMTPHVLPAGIMLDIPEGRAHLPKLELLYDVRKTNIGTETNPVWVSNNQLTMCDCTAEYYGLTTPGLGFNYNVINTEYIFTNYEGNMLFEGKRLDTRFGDYLNFVTATKTQTPVINSFLEQYAQSDYRMKAIASLLGEDSAKITYRSTGVFFNNGYINYLTQLLASVVKYVTPTSLDTPITLPSLISQMTNVPLTNGLMSQGYNNGIYMAYH